MVKIGPKSWFFWLILFFFMSSFALWVTSYNFDKWKTLLRYISMASFINIVFVVVKLRIFKAFDIQSASMKWPLFGSFCALTPPDIVRFYWNFKQRWSSVRTTQCLKNPSEFRILTQMESTQSLQFWSNFGPNIQPEN